MQNVRNMRDISLNITVLVVWCKLFRCNICAFFIGQIFCKSDLNFSVYSLFSIWHLSIYLVFRYLSVSGQSLGDGTYERCQNQNPISISFRFKARQITFQIPLPVWQMVRSDSSSDLPTLFKEVHLIYFCNVHITCPSS